MVRRTIASRVGRHSHIRRAWRAWPASESRIQPAGSGGAGRLRTHGWRHPAAGAGMIASRASTRTRRAIDSPGARTIASTAGARRAIAAANAGPADSRRDPASRRIPRGRRVPQWIGTATAGRIIAAAAAARSGSIWPLPSRNPHPPTGSSATSRPSRELGHGREQVGVAGEVDTGAAARDKAARGCDAGRPGQSMPAVGGRDHVDRHAADANAVARGHFMDGAEMCRRGDSAESARHHDFRAAGEGPQRREVQVVEMAVADEDGVDVLEQAPGGPPARVCAASPSRDPALDRSGAESPPFRSRPSNGQGT